MINISQPILPRSIFIEGYNDWPPIWVCLIAVVAILLISKYGGGDGKKT